jgi:RNA polymerase sigma factor (sigma-70 family)
MNATPDAVLRHIRGLTARENDTRATDRELLERFAANCDETAFEALFRRHAAMVISVGKRVLDNSHDAEDVCQAAFLLLAKKASSQHWQASVASWLHKAAYLLASKARTAATRRALREASITRRPPANPLAEVSGQELLAALDEELLALGEPLRAPLVLCYLQGATRDEAARRLGYSLATLKKRLARGRTQLHAAFARRGLGPAVLLLGTVLTEQVAGRDAPLELARQTARAAQALMAGRSVHGVVSTPVSQLVDKGFGMFNSNGIRSAHALLLLGGLFVAGSALVAFAGDHQSGLAPKQAAATPSRDADPLAAVPNREHGITLRYKFKVGDVFRYVVQAKNETHSSAAGHDRDVTATWTYDVTWKVVGVDSDRNARMTLKVDRFRYVEDNGFPGGKIEFDSLKHRTAVGLPAGVRVLSAVLTAQSGAEFTCTLSPRGEVGNFKVPKTLADAVKNTPGVQAVYSAENFRRQLAGQGSVVLPSDPLSWGGDWKEKSDRALVGGHAKMSIETVATYKGETERDGRKLAEVALEPSAVTIERSPTSGLGPFKLKGHDGKGHLLFDNDKGRLIETEVIQTLDLESAPPGQDEKIIWKVKHSLTTKLVPSK